MKKEPNEVSDKPKKADLIRNCLLCGFTGDGKDFKKHISECPKLVRKSGQPYSY